MSGRSRVRRMTAALVLVALLSCSSSPSNPVSGLITGIEGSAMTVETDEGDVYRFRIGDPAVPAQHLRVHLRDRLPVLITWREEEDGLVATSIVDAPA
jgi:hypothetical protein